MFADPNLEGKTAEEDWEFSSEESEGTAMHRIADGKRKIYSIVLVKVLMLIHSSKNY